MKRWGRRKQEANCPDISTINYSLRISRLAFVLTQINIR